MKNILLSIRPKWCEKICHEISKDKNSKPIYEKEIEMRKTAPKEVPFKVYIYCTKAKSQWRYSDYEGAYENSKGEVVYAQQHIIGEFICDKVDEYNFRKVGFPELRAPTVCYLIDDNQLKAMCLSYGEVMDYGKGKTLYGWHISDLKIYDKPKELSEFYTIDESGSDCCVACVYHETPLDEMPCRTCTSERKYLYRPPQSWQYVEELENEQRTAD